MVKGIVLLSLFALSPASKATSFWDLSGRKSVSQRLRNEGERARVDRGSPMHLRSPGAGLTSLLEEERPYQLFLVRGSRAQGVCSERPDSPRIPSGSPGRAARCARPRAAYPWDRRPFKGWGRAVLGSRAGSPGSAAGSGEAELTQGLRAAERGNRHPMGPGHPGTLAWPDSSGSS